MLTLSAGQINEDVIYNWYDASDKRIYSGQSFSLSPTVTQKYKLEVIAKSDGFKDYDEVNITVKENFISSISPNPPSANMQVAYRIASSVSSAHFTLVEHASGVSTQYVLDPMLSSTQINVSNLPTGTYSLVLVCDGVAQDYENLLIQ